MIRNIIWSKHRRQKTPVVLQMESTECGAASLGIILAYHGCYVPLEELRIACGVSRDGSQPSNILKAARQYGLTAKGFKKSLSKAMEQKPPYMVFWKFKHFVIVEGFRGYKVYLNDPAVGQRKVSLSEFNKCFTGIVLTFDPSEDFQKQKKENKLGQSLRKCLQGSKTALLYIFIVTLMLVIPGILIPTFSRVFVDYYLIDHQYSWIKLLLLGMFFTMILRGTLAWVQKYYLLRLETKISLNTSSSFITHMLYLPVQFFHQRFSGDIASRVALNDRVAQLLSGELAAAVLNIVMVTFYAIVMLQYDVALTIIGIVIASLNLIILQFLNQKRNNASAMFLSEQSKLAGITANGLLRIETVKTMGDDSSYFSRWADYQAKMVNLRQRLMIYNMSTTVLLPFLTAINNIVVLGFGAYRVMTGHLSMGMLVAMQSLLQSFLQPFGQLMSIGGKFQEVAGSLGRLSDVLSHKQDPAIKKKSSENIPQKLIGKVEIADIAFGYNRFDQPLIENFSFTIEPGQRIALVGGSGSGKSTIIKLVSSLYQPWQGNILLDGISKKSLARSTLYHSIALVDQSIFLFEGTIRDNLTLWNTAISEKQIVEAAKNACIHDEIMQREMGYDSLVEEEGRNFSGGQRQRLEIARALVTNPSILLLDEATNALDSATEKKIDDNIRRCGCTCIIVAHRLSTIRDCDEIIVMDKGKIAQRGSHLEMEKQSGAYSDLLKAAML